MNGRRPGETDSAYYARLDCEWEASPEVKAARLLADHDRTCSTCRYCGDPR